MHNVTTKKDFTCSRRRLLDHNSCSDFCFTCSGTCKALPFAGDRACTNTGKKVLISEIWISGLVPRAVYAFHINMKFEIRKQSLDYGLKAR